MSWVVDTCVVIDVLENDPRHGEKSARLLARRLSAGLEVCPVTAVELAPAFDGNLAHQREFFDIAGIAVGAWTTADTETAHQAWHRYITKRRAGHVAKRPVADILIGAYAANRSGLITRNARDFRACFPGIEILEP